MNEPSIIRRLEQIRRTVRLRLVVYGVMAVLAGGMVSFLTLSAIDWLLRLPGLLRLITTLAFMIGAAGAAIHWVIRPVRARIDTTEIARQLERRFAGLRDRLATTVQFLQAGSSDSAVMTERVIANTDAEISKLRLESALSLRPLGRCALWFAVSACVFGLVLGTAPNWVRTGFYRHIDPFGAVEWPRRVEIVPLTAAESVAMGESVTVRMAVQRGLHDRLRAIVRLREPNGEVFARTAQRDRDGTFFATIDAVTRDLEYWFEAGDASTAENPFRIRVVRRPEVVEALATVHAPPYAPSVAAVTQSLSDGPVRAPIGGAVQIAIRASKPIPTATTAARAALRLADGSAVPLVSDPSDANRLTTTLTVHENSVFRVELRDEEGFSNRGAVLHAIHAVPDAPPTVIILKPLAVVETTPNGAVEFHIKVADDFGLSAVSLDVERSADGQRRSVDLVGELTGSAAGDRSWTASTTFKPSMLSAEPGAVLVCSAVATDNRRLDDAGGQTSVSNAVRIKVISPAEFDMRIRDERDGLEDRLRRALLAQTELLDGTRSVQRAAPDAAALTDTESAQVRAMAGRQSRVGSRLEDLAERFAELRTRIVQNEVGDPTVLQNMVELSLALRRLAAREVRKAGGALTAAGNAAVSEDQQKFLAEVSENQVAVVEQLTALLANLAKLGDFQTLVSRTRDLLDAQTELRTRTQHMGRSLLGKTVESLTPEEAAGLRGLERRQVRVADEVKQLLSNIQRAMQKSHEKDPSGEEALDNALRTARMLKLENRVQAAAEAIADNRTAAASIEQKSSANALRRMLQSMQERQKRELERLSKTVRDAAAQVAEVLEAQRDLQVATKEAAAVDPGEAAMAGMSGMQRTIRNNTQEIGEELEDRIETLDAARLVRSAAEPMAAAEQRLAGLDAEAAVAVQGQAMGLLEQALELLQALDEKIAEASLQRTLGEIQDALSDIAEIQEDINGGVDKLHEAVAKSKRVRRAQAREAARLAREQNGLRRRLDEWLPDLQDVVVFAWSLTGVRDRMDESRRMLDNRKIDDALVESVERILRDLRRLVAAIDETRKLPEPEFAEAEEGGAGGGGGAAAQAAKKPVPTVTELLVLKSLQRDLVERTRRLHEEAADADVTEAQLRKIVVLGEDQAEIRNLAEKLTKRARER